MCFEKFCFLFSFFVKNFIATDGNVIINDCNSMLSGKEIGDIESLGNKVLLVTVEEKITAMNDLIQGCLVET